MKKSKWLCITSIMLLTLFAGGCAQKVETKAVTMFSEWTEEEIFAKIPAMIVKNSKVGEVTESTADTSMIDIRGTQLSDYKAYLKLLEECGFQKHSDNGEDGLYQNVYTASYQKDTLTVTVIHTTNTEKTYIMAGEEILLSDHLIYDDSYIKDNKTGAKTTLHAMELFANGNSFLIQLKNGHFIMNDGGHEVDLPKLVDYMETLVPEGEKPVIDAWFISHVHGDHVGCFNAISTCPELRDRICVEAMYFNEPGADSIKAVGAKSLTLNFMIDYKFLRSSKGEAPVMYCPTVGQKYYFNDVVVEIMFSQEIHPIENYGGGLNDISTWLMYRIEDQKFLLPGDAAYGSMQAVMNLYDKEVMELDLFAVSHHGINVYNYFTDYLTLKTVVYTNYRIGSVYATGGSVAQKQNDYLVQTAKESIAWGDGTKVFTFPYVIGTVETMPAIDWGDTETTSSTEARTRRIEEYKTYILNQ